MCKTLIQHNPGRGIISVMPISALSPLCRLPDYADSDYFWVDTTRHLCAYTPCQFSIIRSFSPDGPKGRKGENMLENYFIRTAILKRHRDGLLGPYLDSFVSHTRALGYAKETVQRKCWILRDLGRWMERNGLGIDDLEEDVISRFVKELWKHNVLIRCCGGKTTAKMFLDHIRKEGVVATKVAAADDSELGKLTAQYSKYLEQERGLVQNTNKYYVDIVRRFLVERFGDSPLQLFRLQPSDVSDFILNASRSYAPKRIQMFTTVLRSFFRFLLMRGDIRVNLADVVPTARNWRQSSIPQYLSEDDVQRMLDVCDRSNANGQRDYAILLLLARLGLRACEIPRLEIDDINWRAGEIMVRGKGEQHDYLPLLAEVGEALADYIQYGRPSCTTRRVFIRARSPYRPIAEKGTVTTLVRTAMRRAGLNPEVGGPHLLRHSLATGLLRKGATMAEIGQVLRHRSANTTEIYAKVDFAALRQLAQPWPIEEGGR